MLLAQQDIDSTLTACVQLWNVPSCQRYSCVHIFMWPAQSGLLYYYNHYYYYGCCSSSEIPQVSWLLTAEFSTQLNLISLKCHTFEFNFKVYSWYLTNPALMGLTAGWYDERCSFSTLQNTQNDKTLLIETFRWIKRKAEYKLVLSALNVVLHVIIKL